MHENFAQGVATFLSDSMTVCSEFGQRPVSWDWVNRWSMTGQLTQMRTDTDKLLCITLLMWTITNFSLPSPRLAQESDPLELMQYFPAETRR